jgi:hypothetical protein
LLLFLFNYLKTRRTKRLFSGILLLLLSLNLVQFYQHAKWIFPPYDITGAIYKDSFFSLSLKARSYIPVEGITGKTTFTNDMESDKGTEWMNPITRTDSVFHQGHWSSKADRKVPYSIGLESTLGKFFTSPNRIVLIKAWVLAPKEVTEATLVVDYQSNGKSLSYNQFILDKYVPVDKWTLIEVAYYIPMDMPENGVVKIYFYNPSPLYKLYVDDMTIDFISLKDEPDFHKIEGVFMPEKIK